MTVRDIAGARWRCFVAVPTTPEARATLGSIADRWRAEPVAGDLRLIPSERWHITLTFLGDVRPDEAGALAQQLRHSALGPPIHARLAGVGAFPTPRRARVVWAGVDDPDGRIHGLADRVRSSLGVEGAEPFRPHVTLARARHRPLDLDEAVRTISAACSPVPWPIDRVELVRSHLGASPRYEVLATVHLPVVPAGA